MSRFLQRREMRYGLQAYRVAQLRHVVKKSNDATVIGLEKCFEYQAGKQLRLRELFRGKTVGVSRQTPFADSQRRDCHHPW